MKKNYLIALLCSLSILQASAQFVAASQAIGSSTNVTIAKPAGVLQDDVMIAAVHAGWCSSGSAVTPPAGWTLINQTSNTGSGCGSSNTSIQLATFYKVAGASEPANYTFTGTTSQLYVGGIVAYSDVDIVAPINASSNNGSQETCNAIVASGVTTTSACTRLVSIFICSVNSSATNIVPQASLTERLDVGTTGNHPWGNENLEMSDEMSSTLGATGNRTASLTGCSGSGWVTAGQLISLKCEITTGIENQSLNNLYMVSPNPSSGIFEIAIQDKNAPKCNMEVYDCLGKVMKQTQIQELKTTVDLTDLPKGMYFLKLVSTQGTLVKKIIIQ